MLLPITFVKFYHKDLSNCDVPLPLVTTNLVDIVTNVASNLWYAHFQNFGSVTVTGSTSMAKILIFLSFGSILDSAIENSKNKPQSYFMKLTSILIIFPTISSIHLVCTLFYLSIPPLHTVPLQALATLVLSSLSFQWCPTWHEGFILG